MPGQKRKALTPLRNLIEVLQTYGHHSDDGLEHEHDHTFGFAGIPIWSDDEIPSEKENERPSSVKYKTPHPHSDDYGAPAPNNEYGDGMEQEQQSSARYKHCSTPTTTTARLRWTEMTRAWKRLEMMESRA